LAKALPTPRFDIFIRQIGLVDILMLEDSARLKSMDREEQAKYDRMERLAG
jgi:hypothetical protein